MLDMFNKNPNFNGNVYNLGVKFPDFGKIESIERRYLGKIQKKAL